ncbi:glycosyltransferase involved in cell wall biosynthesis [Propionicimonas paludicola]|uniref:Glycosyltransferase involved in cell wall biosynthesis n=1 Tax=Propionicimonas paludicola TaxID=185243 RepID=A0A2A9CUD4_9ACTN|nr:glycosyltransferase [Propionicimonas paludicola]PFG17169.1 glycosyltransferase involved in cell wall biosynthesis [Propionicimonas paludicola]
MPTLVSVVVPAWNVAHLLPRCLDSLLAQSHRPLEIIVVDDGSTDGTAAVMQDYHERHPEVHLISQPHRNVGPARNAGLSVARGEYVGFVDADDWVEPEFYAKLVGIAETSGADVVVCGLWFHLGRLRAPFPFLPRASLLSGDRAASLALNPVRMPSFAWNKLYRRALLGEEAPFPAIYYEDIATTPRILARCTSVALTRRSYYHYCMRRDSITGSFAARHAFAVASALNLVRHDLQATGRWEQDQVGYRRLVWLTGAMVSIQILFQPHAVPWRLRLPLLRRFRHRLRTLTGPIPPGRALRVQELSDADVRTTHSAQPHSAAVIVATSGGGDTTPGAS